MSEEMRFEIEKNKTSLEQLIQAIEEADAIVVGAVSALAAATLYNPITSSIRSLMHSSRALIREGHSCIWLWLQRHSLL